MSYLTEYRNRLRLMGSDVKTSTINSTKTSVNNAFTNSLFTDFIKVNGIQFEANITQKKESSDKQVLFRPDTKIDIGSVVEIKGKSYLVIDFIGEGINEIYPTAKLKLCNSTFPIQSNKSQILVGTDSEGRPIYQDTYETTYLPCVVTDKLYVNNADEQLPLPEGKLLIIVQFIDFNMVKENYEFTMYNSAYKVTSIDYTKVVNNKGYITIHADKVVS